MTAPAYGGPPAAPARRRVDVLGLIAVILAGVGLVPTLLVFLIGLIPEMNAIWWLGIVIIPLLAIGGIIVGILGISGVVLGIRRRTRYALSVIGVALGLLMLAPAAWVYLSSVFG